MLYAQGDHEGAKSKLQQVIAQVDDEPAPYLTLGVICEEEGKVAEAARFYMLAAELSKRNPLLWKRVGGMFVETGEWANAAKCFERSFAQNSSDSSVLYMRAQVYEKMGKLKRAASDYSKFIDREPHVLNAYKELSRIYHSLGQHAQVAETLSRGYEVMTSGEDKLSNADPHLLNMYCECKLLEGEWASVVKAIEQASIDEPLPLQLLAKLAIAHCYLNQISQAETHLNYIGSQPVEEWSDLFKDIADCLTACELAEHALQFLLPLSTLDAHQDQRNYSLVMQIVNCYIKLGKTTPAIQHALGAFNSIVLSSTVEAKPSLTSSEKKIRVKICLTLSELYRASGCLSKAIGIIDTFQNHPSTYKSLPRNTSSLLPASHVDLFENQPSLPQEDSYEYIDFENDCRLDIQKARLYFDTQQYKQFVSLLTPILTDSNLLFFKHKKKPRLVSLHADTKKKLDSPSVEPTVHRKNIWMLTGMLTFATTLTNFYQCLALQEFTPPPFETLQKLFNLVTGEQEFILVDSTARDQLHFAFATIAHAAHRYDTAISALKPVCFAHPNNAHVWQLFYKIVSSSRKFFITRGFILRLLKKNVECIPLLLLAGHVSQAAGSHRNALTHYLTALRLSSKTPLLLLCIAVAYLNLATCKGTTDRHGTVAKAFAFLSVYYKSLLNSRNNNTFHAHQARYNLARAYHQLNLLHLAIPLYESVLSDYVKRHDNCASSSPTVGHLKREAAYNLSLAYRSKGNPLHAIRVLKTHLTI